MADYIRWFSDIKMGDIAQVGGKNASLGEMIGNLSKAGVTVPDGFAITVAGYHDFLAQKNLDKRIQTLLKNTDVSEIKSLKKVGQTIRDWITETPIPLSLVSAVTEAYHSLGGEKKEDVSVAVRSSATAEDLPEASFAGQQETFLNVKGVDRVLERVKTVFASLFNDRAISYRKDQGFDQASVFLSIGIQRMVRSDLGASGVIFTMDTESGFPDVVFITASWGLGESVVQGSVNPDEFYVYKPALAKNCPAIIRRNIGEKAVKMVYASPPLNDKTVSTVKVSETDRAKFSLTNGEIEALARIAVSIEKHYGSPMDIEWAKDGEDGQLYILQARPETVESRTDRKVLETYHLKQRGTVLTTGRAIGRRIGEGRGRIVQDIDELEKIQKGDVLITDITDPDWEPAMKRASAIVTNRGGRTCHAAIIAREMGVPAVVGCGEATEILTDNEEITISCSEGDTGYVYKGFLPFEKKNPKPG